MKSPISNEFNDEEIAKLYQQVSNTDAPSSSLDAAILAAAHKAVDAKPSLLKPARSMAKRNWAQRWQLPMGIAATVVLSASLTIVMMYEKPEVITQPTVISANDSASTVEMATPATAQTQSPISANNPTESEQASEPSTVSPSTTASEAPLGESLDNAMPQKKLAENRAASQQASTSKPGAQPASKPAQIVKPFADEIAPVAAAQPSASSAPSPTASPELAAAAPAAANETKEIATEQIKSVAARKQNKSIKTETADAAVAQQVLAELSPEAWLDDIDELRKTGKLDAAKQSLKAFKARYPDYTLPKELLEFGE